MVAKDFVENCRKIIAIDSSPSHGTKQIGEFFANLAQQRGLTATVLEDSFNDQDQVNVIARFGKQRPEAELLLATHLDTADPGPFGLWTETGHNPFDAVIKEGRIFGLGSADVKLDFLCKLEAVCSFPSDTKWTLPPTLVGTYGAELGMVGCMKLIRKIQLNGKWALVGEASGLQLISAGKGFVGVDILIPFSSAEMNYRADHNQRESTATQSKIFHGKPAHASTPHLGENAIQKMLEYLMNLPSGLVIMGLEGGVGRNSVPSHAYLEMDYASGHHDSMASKISAIFRSIRNLESEFLQYQDATFTPSHPTLNIGYAKTFDNHIQLSGSGRFPPLITHEIYQRWMQNLAQVCASVGAELQILDYKRPFSTDVGSAFSKGCLEELKSLRLHATPATQSTTNEASLLSRVGIECLCFGPGEREGNIHTPRENVALEDLEKAVEFYKNVIKRFCL